MDSTAVAKPTWRFLAQSALLISSIIQDERLSTLLALFLMIQLRNLMKCARCTTGEGEGKREEDEPGEITEGNVER